MILVEVLDKFTNDDFLISVNGWCLEKGFWEYAVEKKDGFFYKFRNKEVLSMSILSTNDTPELCITIEE